MARKPKTPRKQSGSAPAAIVLDPITSIPFSSLLLSSANVRTIYDQESIDALASSIAFRGLLQSLSVRSEIDANGNPTSRFEVQAGGRRYRALQALINAGRLAPDTPIPCIVKDSGLAEDHSLAENSDRENLHPLDEFNAFATMKTSGMSEDAIAAAYRVTPAFVRQRLRLAAASPTIKQAFAVGKLELEELVAFCVTEDHARQDAIFERIINGEIQAHAHIIRQLLTENTVRSNDARVKFVGIEAYEAAGGAVLRDLFTDDRAYLQNPDLLNKLVSEKLEAAKNHALQSGWKWVEAGLSFDYGTKQKLDRLIPLDIDHTKEERDRLTVLEVERDRLYELDDLTEDASHHLQEVEDEIEAIENKPVVYADEDKAIAGVFISLDYSGELVIDQGYVRPEDKIVREGAAAGEAKVDEMGPRQPTDGLDEGDTEAPGKPLPESLQQDLTSFRTVAIREALGNNFEAAFIAVLHALASQHFYHGMPANCLQITSQRNFPASAPGLDTWGTTLAIDKRNEAMRKVLPQRHEDLWNALWALDDDARKTLFAHCTASTVNAVKARHNDRGDVLPHADQLVAALGMTMSASDWITTADNYFNRVTKAHILEAVTEAKDETTANLLLHLKKDAMAAEAERLVAGTNWVPQLLRSPIDGNSDAGPESLPDFLTIEEEQPTAT